MNTALQSSRPSAEPAAEVTCALSSKQRAELRHLIDFWSVVASLGALAEGIQASIVEATSGPRGGPDFHATMYRLTEQLQQFSVVSTRYEIFRDEYERGIHGA